MVNSLKHIPVLEGTNVRAVIMSDLHAVQTSNGDPVAEDTSNDASSNALTAALEMVTNSALTADLLICPGDLIEAGDPAPLEWVWAEMHRMASALGAKFVANLGNHDLALNPTPGQDPLAAVRRLSPRFPGPDASSATHFWGDGFSACESLDGRWLVVSVNTCTLHGYNPINSYCGELREDTLPELKRYLGERVPASINILVCHHPPQEWTHREDVEPNHLKRGDLLLDLLDLRPERWMVLHGHKHQGVLDYYGRGTGGSIRFAASSVGANVTAEDDTANQIHIVDFHTDASAVGLPLAGEVFSMDWHQGHGWLPAIRGSGLTDRCGFGFRRDGAELAYWLEDTLGSTSLSWDNLSSHEPRVKYLAPRDLETLIDVVSDPAFDRNGDTAGSVRVSQKTGRILEVTLR